MSGMKGRSGRRKAPLNELIARGSPYAKKRMAREPDQLSAMNMKPPPDYSPEEVEIWERHHKMLSKNKTLSGSDFVSLDSFCRTYAEMIALEKDIKIHGLTQVDAKGVSRLRPEARLRSEVRKELRALAAGLGLSPTSRGGVEKIPEKEKFWKIEKLT